MSGKPIFVATHPRACSTAFERVFMTRHDILQTVHEPFGDAYYFGPERLAPRYEHDEQARIDSGFSDSTYKTIMDRINKENTEDKRLFIKDMAQYFIPPSQGPVCIAPSLIQQKRKGVGTNGINGHTDEDDGTHFESTADVTNGQYHTGPTYFSVPFATEYEPDNPTVVPRKLLQQFQWTFLIRHPRNSIPSYYRCCIPPLDDLTGFHDFRPDEAGYDELRRLFEYLTQIGLVGPNLHGRPGSVNTSAGGSPQEAIMNGHEVNGNRVNGNGVHFKRPVPDICVIDADDLLDNPEGIIEAFCENVGIEYSPKMLVWDDDESHAYAREQFEKWRGFHEDAIGSRDLKPRAHKKQKTDEELYNDWVAKYGAKGARQIKKTVQDCVGDYEYLKQFCIQPKVKAKAQAPA